MKTFNIMLNVGKCRYLVNFYDGIKKHSDGSNAWDCMTCRNKKQLNTFTSKLINDGYVSC